jgi:transcriptional regulator with XRE-family HTH domain
VCDVCGGFGNGGSRGRELRHKRVHEGRFPQEQLASRLGISGRELNDIECGRVNMPAHVKGRLLEKL